MNPQATLEVMLRLLGVLAVVHGAEFLRLRSTWSDAGVWRWDDLKTEIAGRSPAAQKAWGVLLGARGFLTLNWIRAAAGAGAMVFPQAWLALVLLAIHVLTLLRWRGSYNGGSDFMNLLLLMGVSAGLVFESTHGTGFAFLWYCTLQLLLSYYRSGFVKIKNGLWRRGQALQLFLSTRRYEQGVLTRHLAGTPALGIIASWGLMLFELSFPLSLLGPRWAVAYMTAGAAFHLITAYTLGLNRFFFAWIAAYPALYYCAQ